MKVPENYKGQRPARSFTLLRFAILGSVLASAALYLGPIGEIAQGQDAAKAAAGSAKTAPALGTIKSISGNSLVLASDAGAEINVEVRDSTKIVRIAPGQTNLKDAQPIAVTDLQVGDRILVRGQPGADNKSVGAASIFAMKKADIADKQTHEREDWQKSGVGGLVSSVDAGNGVITITVPSLREKKNVAVHISKSTILRRYAPGSVKFDDAKPGPLEEIRPGDQLRARGEKSADGNELTATEVVSGSFRNISGTIEAVDSGDSIITVHDLATKKNVTVKLTSESQLRKLPAPVAQRIAQRLNGGSGGAQNGGAQSAAGGNVPGGAPAAKEPADAGQASVQASGTRGGSGGFGGRGPGGGGSGGAVDLQQMISRMPAYTITDLQKGDAVMLVGTEANGSGNAVTAITLLAGVEPILQSSPNGGASSILSPWSLSSAPSGDAGTP